MAQQHKSILFWIIPFLAVFLAVPLQLLAQGGATGALTGEVEDPSGAVIVGAQVQVLNVTTGEVLRTETTGSAGLFAFTLLPASTYNVQVSAPGFAQMVVRNVEVRVTETTRLPISLKAKTGTQTVEVQSEAENIETTAATTGNSLGGSEIRELPLATRNFQQLLALSAGASSSLNAAAQLGRGDVRIQVNGGREDDNNYQIEGLGANDSTNQGELAFSPLPSPDSIQEFKVATSLYDATQGRNGGGNINAILKSGTKSIHFDAFEYFRNTDLNANDFFLKGYGLDRPVIKQNIFGGSVGGPVGPDAKLGFFFLNYQGTRQQSGDSPGAIISTNIPYVPLADRLSITTMANDFGVPAVDPMAFALLSFPSNQFGLGAGGYLFPLPAVAAGTAPGTLVPFRVSLPGRFNDDQFTANWDRDFHGGKDRLAERFFFSDSETKQPFGADSFQLLNGGVGSQSNLDFPIDIPLRNRFASLAETHLFTDHLVNDIRFGVNVISYKFNNVAPVTVQDLGIDRPTNNVSSDMYRLDFAGIGVQMGPFPSSPMSSLSDGISLLETLSWVHGDHNFRFGGGFDHADVRRFNPIDDDGFLFFAPGPGVTDFQNFLVGNLAPGTLVAGGLANHDYKIPNFSIFVQDDYRATKTLTVNLGFRVDWNGAPYDALCHEGNFDPNLLAATGQPFFWPKCIDQFNLPGVTGTAQRSGLDNNYTTVLQPRIGLAYDVGGHHTTSIRTGYGIYTVREDIGSLENMILTPPTMPQDAPAGPNPIPGGDLANYFSANGPNAVPAVGQINKSSVPHPSLFSGFSADGLCDDISISNPTTTTPCFTGNVLFDFAPQIPRRFISPTMQQWNLTVERSLGRNWTLQVGYFGSKGTHLREVNDANQPMVASPTHPITITVKDPNSPVFGQTYTIMQNTAANNPSSPQLNNINARVPYPGSAPFGYEKFGQDANSHYSGLDLTVSHRFSKGLTMQSAYTFSKATDDTSTASVAFDTHFNNQLTGVASRGPSDFDRRQRWITNYDYALPFFAQRHDFAGRALGGWEFSGVFTLQSGAPFTVVDSAGGTGYGLSSPDLVTPVFAPGFSCANALTSGSTESRLNGYLNRNAFMPAPVLPFSPDNSTGYGDVGRNCFHGPRQLNLDFSVSRSFHVTERQQLKFSAEFFNLTNTPSFGNPAYPVDIETAAPGATSFGKINQVVGTPRLVQFALRYAF